MSAFQKPKKNSPLDLWEQKKAPTIDQEPSLTQLSLSQLQADIKQLKYLIENKLTSHDHQKKAALILKTWLNK